MPVERQEQVGSHDANGALTDSALDVGFLRLLCGLPGLVATKREGTVATQSVLEFDNVPYTGEFPGANTWNEMTRVLFFQLGWENSAKCNSHCKWRVSLTHSRSKPSVAVRFGTLSAD